MTDRTCIVDGCEKRAKARGMCDSHYNAARSRGDLTGLPRRPRSCTIAGCDSPMKLHDVCVKHYTRMKRTGSYEITPMIVPGDTRPHSSGYVMVYAPGHVLTPTRRYVFEHRIVMFDTIGYGPHQCGHCGKHINWGAGLEVDHLDYDRANNDLNNLVPSCHACNTRRARHANQFTQRVMTLDMLDNVS